MESLAPSLRLTLKVRTDLQQGIALYDSIQNFCMGENSDFADEVNIRLLSFPKTAVLPNQESSLYAQTLFDLIEEGLAGGPISERLKELEVHMIEECQRNIDEAAIILPYKGLLPLLLLMFPSLLILLLSPILTSFFEVFE